MGQLLPSGCPTKRAADRRLERDLQGMYDAPYLGVENVVEYSELKASK